MNDELLSRLTKYLDSLESATGTAAGFVSEQAPLVVQEYLAWYFWSSVAAVAFAVIVAVASIAAARYLRRRLNFLDNGNDYAICCFMAQFAAALILLIVVPIKISDIVKVCVAPRIVILEKTAEFAKQINRTK